MPAASRNFNENDPGVVVHGAVASTPRPVYHGQVFWIGTVEPINQLANDIWVNPNGTSNGPTSSTSGEYTVNTVVASGAAETLTLAPAHRVTMDQNCTFTFPTPTAGHTFLLWLSGAFTPTFPASVDWDSATPPTYATPSLYGFTTLDGGTTWIGTLIASGLG